MADQLRIVKHAASGATLGYYLIGATVVSWSAKGETKPLAEGSSSSRLSSDDIYFVSNDAVYREGKGIRGGIPIAFPQFAGEGPLPNHGFVRSSVWTEEVAEDGVLVLSITDNESTRAVWDHAFKLELRVEFDDKKCHTMLTVVNTGAAPVEFQALLHTYYHIGDDIGSVKVNGLKGLQYFDKVLEFKEFTNEDEALVVTGETDRIHQTAAPAGEIAEVSLDTPAGTRKITFWTEQGEGVDALTEKKAVDVVVWNPWIEKAQAMGDFGNEEYQNMICVEPGSVRNKATLPQGQAYRLNQVIEV